MSLLFIFNQDGTLKKFEQSTNLVQGSSNIYDLNVKVENLDISDWIAMAEYKRSDGKTSNDIALAYKYSNNEMSFYHTIPAWATQLAGKLEITIKLIRFDDEGNKQIFAFAKNNVNVLESTSEGDEDVNINEEQYNNLLQTIVDLKKYVDNSIGATGVGEGSITTDKLKDGAVTSIKIANKNVTENKLSDDVVNKLNKTFEIGEGTISEKELGSNSVTSDKIYKGAVTTDKIANENVTMEKLSTEVQNAIKSGSGNSGDFVIGASSVGTNELKDNAVVTNKILNGNVTSDKLATNSVTTDKILNGNVTEDKLNQSVKTKLNKTFEIGKGTIGEEKLSDDVKTKLNKTFEPTENSLNANVLIDESITQSKLNSEVLNLIGNSGMTIKGRAGAVYVNNNPYAEGEWPDGTLLDELGFPMKLENAIKGDTYIIGSTLYKFDKKVNGYSTFTRVCDLIGDRSIAGWDIKLKEIGNEHLRETTISRDKLNLDLKKELDWYASATNSFAVPPDTTESDNQWKNLPFGTYRFLPNFNIIENYLTFYIDINYIYNDMSGVQQNKTIRVSYEDFVDYNSSVSKFINVKAKLSTFVEVNSNGRRYEKCHISVIITTDSGDLIKKSAYFEMYENDYRNLNISFIYGEALYSFNEQSQIDDELNRYLPEYAKKNRIRSESELDDYTQEGIYNLVKTYEIDNSVIPITLKVEYKDDELYQYYRVEDGTKESGYFTRKMKPKEIEDENGDYSFKDIEWEYVKDTKFKDFILNEDIEFINVGTTERLKLIADYVLKNKTKETKPFFINRRYYITQEYTINNRAKVVHIFDMSMGKSYHTPTYEVNKLPENIDDIIIEENRNSIAEELEQQIENLQAQIDGIPVREKEVSTNAYKQEVPNNALDYALVEEIGGMSYEENGVFYHTKVTSVDFEQKNLIQLQERTQSSTAYTAEIDKDGWVTLNKTAGNGDMWLTIANQNEFYLPKDKSYSARVRYYDEKIPNIGSVVFLYEGVSDTPTTRFMTLGYKDGSGYPSTQLYATKNVGKIYIHANNNLAITNAKFKVELVENDFINDSIEIPEVITGALQGYGLGINVGAGNYNYIKYNEEENKYYFHKNVASYTFTGNETIYTNAIGSTGKVWFQFPFSNNIYSHTNENIAGTLKMELLDTIPSKNVANGINGIGTKNGSVFFYLDNIQTLGDFKTYITGKTLIYKLATPEVIDISSYMNDEYLQVQENGVVKFVNEKQKAVPNKITYAIKVV